jgi:hypothetical protein
MHTASFPLVERLTIISNLLKRPPVPLDSEFEASYSRLFQTDSTTLETEVAWLYALPVTTFSAHAIRSRVQIPTAWRYLPIVLAVLKRRRREGHAPLSVEKNERSICHDLCHIKLFFTLFLLRQGIG